MTTAEQRASDACPFGSHALPQVRPADTRGNAAEVIQTINVSDTSGRSALRDAVSECDTVPVLSVDADSCDHSVSVDAGAVDDQTSCTYFHYILLRTWTSAETPMDDQTSCTYFHYILLRTWTSAETPDFFD
jgi:hypothetical protein